MKYRNFPGTDVTVSALGMGCMRLPLCKDEPKIDFPRAVSLIRSAIDRGLTYVDTAYGYHDGQSEALVGQALSDGYRERVTLTTKLPVWKVEKPEDMEALLDEQLARLGTPYVDFYLLHALNRERFQKMKALGALQFLDEMKKKGKIRHAGFSFHDGYDAFREIIDSYPWELAQAQMNFFDEFHQATLKGVEYAASKGIGVVVMEPLRGGALVKAPDNVQAVYDSAKTRRSPQEWAFRWLIDRREFVTILSGMSDESQLFQNLEIFGRAESGCMTDDEREIMRKAREAYEARVRIGCTNCRYCQPCPEEIPIPDIFGHYDTASIFDTPKRFADWYQREIGESRCARCGKCEGACPQKIPIRDWLSRIAEERAF